MRSALTQWPRALATVLDGVVIVVGAIAVVLVLGGPPFVKIGGQGVLLPQGWRLILFAAAVSILRYGIDRDAPVLPLLRADDIRGALDAERERFARSDPAPPEVKYIRACRCTGVTRHG